MPNYINGAPTLEASKSYLLPIVKQNLDEETIKKMSIV
jgi:hypothetical protein